MNLTPVTFLFTLRIAYTPKTLLNSRCLLHDWALASFTKQVVEIPLCFSPTLKKLPLLQVAQWGLWNAVPRGNPLNFNEAPQDLQSLLANVRKKVLLMVIGFVSRISRLIWQPEKLLAGIPGCRKTLCRYPLISVPLIRWPKLLTFCWFPDLIGDVFPVSMWYRGGSASAIGNKMRKSQFCCWGLILWHET